MTGFKKDQLKVQVTTNRKLRVSGERPLNNNKWSQFKVEVPIPSNSDVNEISAKFEGGSLYVKHPKIITAEDNKQQRIEQQKERATLQDALSKPQTPEEAKMQKVASKQKAADERASAQQVPPKTGEEKQQSEKVNGDSEAKTKNSEKSEDDKTSGLTTETDKSIGKASLMRDKPGVGGFNQVVSRFLNDTTQPRKFLINLVVTSVLVLVVAMYIRNAIRSTGKSDN